jgi:hypothetical protein
MGEPRFPPVGRLADAATSSAHFSHGAAAITDQLAFMKKVGQVTYFNGHMPVFCHVRHDIATFRIITSQFCVTGYVKQADILRAFGVTPISVKRRSSRTIFPASTRAW